MGLLDDIALGSPPSPSGGLLDRIAQGEQEEPQMSFLDRLAAGGDPGLAPPPSVAPGASLAQQEPLSQDDGGFPFAKVAATGARVLFPIVGGAAVGAGTGGLGAAAGLAAGGAAGELTAQAIERAFLGREEFEALPIAGEAALGAAVGPLSAARRAFQAGRAVSSLGRVGARLPGLVAGGLEGATIGAGAQAVQSLSREGELPSLAELALGGAVGGALGGGLGALQRPAGQAAKAAQAAQAVGPEDAAGAAAPKASPIVATAEEIAEATDLDRRIREQAGEVVPEINRISAGDMRELVRRVEKGVEEGLDLDQVLASTPSGQAMLRTTRQVDDAVSAGRLSTEDGREILNVFGVFGLERNLRRGEISEKVSSGAKAMNAMAQVAKIRNRLVKSKAFEEELETAEKLGLRQHVKDLFQLRRAGLVAPLPTAIRNLVSQFARYNIEIMNDAFRGLMGDATARDRALFAAQNLFSPRQAQKRIKLITGAKIAGTEEFRFPQIAKELFRFRATEGKQTGKVFGRFDREKLVNNLQVMNLWLNTATDDFIRALSADSSIRAIMKRTGSLPAYLDDPTRALAALDSNDLSKIFAGATRTAQEISFAEAPTGFFKTWSNIVEMVPELTLATPFPRFMGSAFNFIRKHNPGGLLRAFTPDNASSPEALREIYARALTGTSLLAGAFALRSSSFKGDKATEIRDPETGRVFDTRSMQPLSFYVPLADIIFDIAEGRPPGEIPTETLRDMALGIGRFSDAVPAGFELLVGRGDAAGANDLLQQIAGDFLGGFARPVVGLRDILEGMFDYERSVDKRATTASRLIGGFASQVPFGGEIFDLPPVINPATGQDVIKTKPIKFMGQSIPASIFEHVSGLNLKDRTEVERVLIELEIDPFKRVQSERQGRDPLPGAELATAKQRNIARTLTGPLLAAHLAPRVPAIRKALTEAKTRDEKDRIREIVSGILTRVTTAARERAQIMMAQQDPRAALSILGSGPTQTVRQRALRRAARERLATQFGAP